MLPFLWDHYDNSYESINCLEKDGITEMLIDITDYNSDTNWLVCIVHSIANIIL